MIPIILSSLIHDSSLSIPRAMNYSRILYGQLYSIDLPKLLDMFEPIDGGQLDLLVFFGSLDPSSFRLYSYWYSQFLHYVTVCPSKRNYKRVKDLDFLLKT